MSKQLVTVAQLCAATPFTPGQVRFWIFSAANNGLDTFRAVVRVGGRRVYIDRDAFDRWIDAQQPQQGAA